MSTREETFTEAANAGRLTGLTLWKSEQGWQANRRNPDGSFTVHIDHDPVKAILGVLGVEPPPPLPSGVFG